MFSFTEEGEDYYCLHKAFLCLVLLPWDKFPEANKRVKGDGYF